MDNLMNDLGLLLLLSTPLLPFLIIHMVGAILSVNRWQRYPITSRLAFIAFAGFSARVFLGIVKNWLFIRRDALGWDAQTLAFNTGIISGIDILVGIVAWILLLIAFYARYEMSERSAASGEECSGMDEQEGRSHAG